MTSAPAPLDIFGDEVLDLLPPNAMRVHVAHEEPNLILCEAAGNQNVHAVIGHDRYWSHMWPQLPRCQQSMRIVCHAERCLELFELPNRRSARCRC